MSFYFVRHGTPYGGATKLYGQHNVALNTQGIKDTYILLKRIREIRIRAVAASDLLRTKEPAEIIARDLEVSALHIDPRLRECALGSLEDIEHSDVYFHYGENGGKLHGVMRGWEYDFGPYGGESSKSVVARWGQALSDLVKQYGRKKILVIGDFISLNTILSVHKIEPLSNGDVRYVPDGVFL